MFRLVWQFVAKSYGAPKLKVKLGFKAWLSSRVAGAKQLKVEAFRAWTDSAWKKANLRHVRQGKHILDGLGSQRQCHKSKTFSSRFSHSTVRFLSPTNCMLIAAVAQHAVYVIYLPSLVPTHSPLRPFLFQTQARGFVNIFIKYF